MRSLLIIPLVLAVVAGCAYGVTIATGLDLHPRSMLGAAAIGLVAAELAMVPLLLTRGGDSSAMSQASLVATAIHLFVFVGAAAVCVMKYSAGITFTYWLFGFYCLSLILVVVACVRAVRSAPAPAANK